MTIHTIIIIYNSKLKIAHKLQGSQNCFCIHKQQSYSYF
ncbi:unnamed protein product [Paramecium sonneborni]|uniref:Uncharacterized protein n=1 Tax=Paramecium sonneborni TaxID=65129 RepID=A0A8S1N6C9_9CILI|nr:unnamed protein product [Paramecium sonneborni]